jgi:DegV family protein with EDD domain
MARRRVGIVTDSTSDIPTAERETFQIEVIPAILVAEGRSYRDGEDLTRSDFYEQMPTFQQPATTAAPSPQVFEEAFARLFDQGVEQIISLHVAANLSGMLNSAAQAAKSFGDRVRLLDSGQVSMGLGFQVIEAARCALRGLPLDEILEAVAAVRARVCVAALIRSMEYLRRSGRVNWLQAGLGDLLQIKMLLTVQYGLVEALGRARTWSRGLEALMAFAHEQGPFQHVAILHSGIPREAAQLADRFASLCPALPTIVQVTTVIGAHVGPASIGLAGIRSGRIHPSPL